MEGGVGDTREGEGEAWCLMAGLPVFRGASGPSPGRVTSSTAASLSLLSAAPSPYPFGHPIAASVGGYRIGPYRCPNPALANRLHSADISHFEGAVWFPPEPCLMLTSVEGGSGLPHKWIRYLSAL